MGRQSIRHVPLSIMWLGWCVALGGSDAPPGRTVLGLDECVAMALRDHPRVAMAKAGTETAHAARAEARAAYLPRVDAEAQWQRLDEVPSVDIPLPDSITDALVDAEAMRRYARNMDAFLAGFPLAPPPQSYAALRRRVAKQVRSGLPTVLNVPLMGREVFTTTVALRQPVFTGGKIHHRNRQASLAVELARERERWTEHDLKFAVTCPYYGLALAKDLREVADESRRRLKVIADITGKLHRVSSRATEMDHLKARMYLARSEAAVATASKFLALARARLAEAIGLLPEADLEIRDEHLPERALREPLYDQCLDEALAARPELRQARAGTAIGRSAVSLARAAYLPDLFLFVEFHHLSDNESFANPNDEDQWVGGIGGSVPLFTGFARAAKVRKARAELRQAEAAERDAHQRIALDVRAALLELAENRELLRAARAARVDAVARNELAQSGYRHGLVEVEDMIEAQFDELEAHSAYLQALYHYDVADAHLDRVLCR
jgi:outer membrane protein TolC